MNALGERLREWLGRGRAQLESRTPRERWALIGGAAAAVVLFIQLVVVAPLSKATEQARSRAGGMEDDLQLAARMAPKIRQLQAEIAVVEERIQPGQQTDLLRLLEQLAAQAQMKDKLESIRPKTPSRNERYPESRVEVQLRGTTLAQAVQFLYSIETAPLYLIVRSVNIKSRGDESQLLDVNFSVSSFQRS